MVQALFATKWKFPQLENMAQTKGYTPAQWDAIEKDYIEGGGKIPALCEKHGMNFHTVAARARAGRWGVRRRVYSDQVRNPIPPGPQFAIMPPINLSSQITPAFFTAEHEAYYARLPQARRILDDLEKEYFDAVLPADKCALASTFERLWERTRVVVGVPLRAPIKSTEKVARRANIVPLDVEPAAADAVREAGAKSDANGAETQGEHASG
jgi:hypothetical protein